MAYSHISIRQAVGVVLVALACALVTASVALGAAPRVQFTSTPARNLEIANPVEFAWSADVSHCEFRFKLDTPGEALYGVRHQRSKWSAWGDWRSVSYGDFVLEGTYKLTVEARRKGMRETAVAEYPFQMHFVMPAILEEAQTINWEKVRIGKTRKERVLLLAQEYRAAYAVWERVYNAERRALKSSCDPRNLLETSYVAIRGQQREMLISAADKGLGLALRKVMLPKTVYDIVKQLGVDFVLVYRNARTNRAAFNMILCYWAWLEYDALARRL